MEQMIGWQTQRHRGSLITEKEIKYIDIYIFNVEVGVIC